MEDKNVMKRLIISLVIISLLIILVVFVSFILFFNKQKEVDETPIQTGTISMTYKAATNGIQLVNPQPMSDTLGKDIRMDGEYFDFTVTSNMKGNSTIAYEVAVVPEKTSTISSEYIMVYLEKQQSGTYSKVANPAIFSSLKKKTEIGSPLGSMVVAKETVTEDKVSNYRLRIWLKEDAPVLDSTATFAVRVNVYGKAK